MVVGYHNSTTLTLGRGFNHLAKKPSVYSIVVEPLLTYGKPNSASETVHITSQDREHGQDGAFNRRNGVTTFLDCKIVPDFVNELTKITEMRSAPRHLPPQPASPGVPVFSRRVPKTRAFPALLVHESDPETVAGDAVPARTGMRSPFKKRRFGFGVCGFA